ncbi:MAG: hypothetical protein Q8Q02_08630 [Nocardioides sp.]|nr:hypothetical protein [Nocardioides sp.]
MRGRRGAAVVAVVVVVALVAGGLGVFLLNRGDDYCSTLSDSNAELAAVVGESAESATGSFADSLEVLERLATDAPDSIASDWNTLVIALRGLRDAFVDAGIDLDQAEVRVEDLAEASPEAQAAVTTAATELRSPAVARATASIEDHARQVCGVELGSTDGVDGSPPAPDEDG